MTQFCRKFFREEPHDVASCIQCKKAWEEVQKEDAIFDELDGQSWQERTEEEQAALDCHGQP